MFGMRTRTYRTRDNETIEGVIFHAIIYNHHYYLSEIMVYADGIIDCWDLIDLESFKERLQSGRIRINLPEGSTLRMHNLGNIKIEDFTPVKSNEDFIIEIEDAIEELNGRQTGSEICRELFRQYLMKPSQAIMDSLRTAYHNLPSHQRVLFEGVYYKDPLVQLMETGEEFSPAARQGMLDDYFNEEE